MIWIAFAVVFLVFFNTKIVSAGLDFNSQFGGRIVWTKANEINALEVAGYQCFVLGSSISIIPIIPIGSRPGTPTSYFIPFGTYSKTGHSPRSGQLIMGRYGQKTTINCMLKVYPFTPATVLLDTITLFGNSRI